MAFIKVNNVAIRGISACVPKNIEENRDLPFYGPEEVEQVIDKIGIERRHVAPQGVTASDLCIPAAEKLISELGWERESIDLIAFCTQDPDYVNHPNSFVVHERMGLQDSCMCLDFYHGCPGWVVSLSSVTSMLSLGQVKRAILLDGDTATKVGTPNNREEKPLFGDAGSATALEYELDAPEMFFYIGTKSDDGRSLIIPNGGFRNPYTLESLKYELDRKAGILSMEELKSKMESMDVFSFAISKVPKALKKLCAEFEINIDEIDNLVLHQANKLILENIAKRMKVPMEKLPLSLRDYGNTTSASIPLSIVVDRQKRMREEKQKNLVCGFGTGLSWGTAYFETDRIVCPNVVEI